MVIFEIVSINVWGMVFFGELVLLFVIIIVLKLIKVYSVSRVLVEMVLNVGIMVFEECVSVVEKLSC